MLWVGAGAALGLAASDACRKRISRELPQFVARTEPIPDDNSLFAALRQCATLDDLKVLLAAMAKPAGSRSAVELGAAVEAAVNAPALAKDPAATGLIVQRFNAVRDPAARTALSYVLGWRDAARPLNQILRKDPAAQVRAAAATALRNCRTPPAFDALWSAARLDRDRETRAQAYQTLDRYGQLKTAAQLLAASSIQSDPAAAGRFLARSLAKRAMPAEQRAELLTALAESPAAAERGAALSVILASLEPPSPRPLISPAAAPAPPPGAPAGAHAQALHSVASMPPNPPPDPLARELYRRRDRITRAALAQFRDGAKIGEADARNAIDCALAINDCDSGRCGRLREILAVTDRMSPPLALEASHDVAVRVGAPYFALRLRQYARAAIIAAAIPVAMMLVGSVFRWTPMFAMGAGWLMILAGAALVQFTSRSVLDATVWPPLGLWPATALGSVAAALMLSVAITVIAGRRWLIPAAVLAGEFAWWLVSSLLDAADLTLKMQHYSRGEDWLPFMLAIAMIVVAPLLTLMFSAAAWRIARARGLD